MSTSSNLKTSLSSAMELKEGLQTAANAAKEGRLEVGAVVRLIVLVISWLNQLAVTFGAFSVPDLDPSVLYIVSSAITILVTLYSYWKNNSWTPNAKMADAVLDVMKQSGISSDELLDAVGNIIDSHVPSNTKNSGAG